MHRVIQESDFLLYAGEDGKTRAQVILGDETVWASQKTMSEIFDVGIPDISKHISNIFSESELERDATVSNLEIVQQEGSRQVKRNIDFYNLDAIIAVGYRVNSYKATKFRQWATGILKEYLVKGFVLDDERLKQGKALFGKDYFDELLLRIKEIRASERRFYQKITDLYAMCSADYDPKSPITQTFFATVQNKLEFAITHMTAGEIIKTRAKLNSPNMGLTTWSNAPDGKILKTDVTVAKNYLSQNEIDELNSIVVMYLDFAELQAKRNRLMKMKDWVEKLDSFLKFNEYDILNDAGKVKKAVADKFAQEIYDKFRIIQDREYRSDFDKVVEGIKISGKLPAEAANLTSTQEELSDLKKLKSALNPKPTGIKRSSSTKPKTKECPRCGKVLDKNAAYCDGDIEIDGDVMPCTYSF